MKKITQVFAFLFIGLAISSPYSNAKASDAKFQIDVNAIEISDAIAITPEIRPTGEELKSGVQRVQAERQIHAPEGYRFVRFMITIERIPRTKYRVVPGDFLLYRNGSEGIPASTFYYLKYLSDIDKNKVPRNFAWNVVPGGMASYLMSFAVPREHIDEYQFIVLDNNLGTIGEIQDRLY